MELGTDRRPRVEILRYVVKNYTQWLTETEQNQQKPKNKNDETFFQHLTFF